MKTILRLYPRENKANRRAFLRAFYIFFIAIAALWAMPKNARAQPSQNAYVPNNNGTLSVIDTQTNTVIATIPGGFNHPFCASVSPNGKLL